MKAAPRLAAAGCWVLVLTAALHLVGHFSGPQPPANAEQAELLRLLTTVEHDVGAGLRRTLMDFMNGFSLAYSTAAGAVGALGLLALRRREAASPRAAVGVAAIYAWAQTAIAAIYFFLPPLTCFAVAALLLTVGWIGLGRAARSPSTG